MVTEACLGLVLAWFTVDSREHNGILQGWFGFTGGPCNVWLCFGRGRMLLKALREHPECVVKYPNNEEI
jgi:hypothetical protein